MDTCPLLLAARIPHTLNVAPSTPHPPLAGAAPSATSAAAATARGTTTRGAPAAGAAAAPERSARTAGACWTGSRRRCWEEEAAGRRTAPGRGTVGEGTSAASAGVSGTTTIASETGTGSGAGGGRGAPPGTDASSERSAST